MFTVVPGDLVVDRLGKRHTVLFVEPKRVWVEANRWIHPANIRSKVMRNVVALYDVKGNRKGFYVSDDQDLTQDVTQAHQWGNIEGAQFDAQINNESWMLEPGEQFRAIIV
jgi:hypothetical protein